MPRSIGLIQWRHDDADLWLSQCEGPFGRQDDVVIRPGDREADHVVLIGPPIAADGSPRMPYLARRRAKARGRYDADRLAHALDHLGRERADLTMLVYEPPVAFSDSWFEVARARCSRVFAPDDRATDPITLPATWSFDDPVRALRNETPDALGDRPMRLACIASGKRLWPGHDLRLRFLSDLRVAADRDGFEIEFFGRGLPADLRSRGPVRSKATVLRAADLTLAIENDDTDDRYVTEKLWDPLICWSLPLYHGSRAADAIIPPDAFVRVPSLDAAGIAVIREAVRHASASRTRIEAISEARARALTDLRLVAWIARTLGPTRTVCSPSRSPE
jgi:hypothetical protein